MKESEAISIPGAIRKLQCERENNNTPSIDIAYSMAILALKKQIPNKPADIDEDLGVFRCPSCNEMIYTTDKFTSHKYCLNCGQAIDWSGFL